MSKTKTNQRRFADTRTDSQKYLDYAAHSLELAIIAGDKDGVRWWKKAIRMEIGR